MLHPQGYAVITQDGRVITEYDTFTCAHGNEIVRVAVGTVSKAPFCQKCNARICKKCAAIAHASLEHVPTEMMIQRMERPGRR